MIFRREFSKSLKPLIIWSLLLGCLVFLTLSMYSAFAQQQEGLKSILDSFPEPMKKMFGMHELDFSSILGFYAVEAYLMITLFGSIYAAMLSANIIAKEEHEKTIEFLLSMPVKRHAIISSKLLLVFVNLLLFNCFIAIVSWLGFLSTEAAEVPMKTFLLLVIGGLCTHLVFAATAFLLSATLRRSRNIWPAAIGSVFVTYFLDAVAGLTTQTAFLKHISPFQFFNAADILKQNALHTGYTCVTIALIILCIGLSYLYYHRKDIVT